MILPVFHQGVLFLGTVAAGTALAFVYDILRVARRIVPHSSVLIHIEDFLYWLIVIAAIFGLLHFLNNGELRLFVIAGAFFGMLLYYLFISARFIKVSMTVYGLIKTAVLMVFAIISIPFKAAANILAYPAGVVRRRAGEFYSYEKRVYTGVKIRGKHKARKFKNNMKIILKKI